MSDDNKIHSDLSLTPVGNIGAYIKYINKVPMLEPDDEIALAKRLRDYGDLDAARKLVLSHLRLVVSIARGYLGYGLALSDLIQEGNIGLMKAVKHFDPDVGGRLAAFAVHWIKSEIHDYVIKNWRVVKVATTKAQRKLFFNLRKNKDHLGWFSDDEKNAVAQSLGVSKQDVEEMESRLSGLDIGFDLDSDSDDKYSPTTLSPSAYLEDENSNFAKSFENLDYKNFELLSLKKAIDALEPRAAYIIKRRWLDEDKATLSDLAKKFDISIERVRQIENQALESIKNYIQGLTNNDQKLLSASCKKRGRKKKNS